MERKEINKLKKRITEITGNRVSARNYTSRNRRTGMIEKELIVSNRDSHIDNGFGHYKEELKQEFNIVSLDGGSFAIAL